MVMFFHAYACVYIHGFVCVCAHTHIHTHTKQIGRTPEIEGEEGEKMMTLEGERQKRKYLKTMPLETRFDDF